MLLKKYIPVALALLDLSGFVAMAQNPVGGSPNRIEVRSVSPSTLPAIGSIDLRFQSYNIEMIEVMGGKWWAPYRQQGAGAVSVADPQAATLDVNAASLRFQAPIDLANPRLRILAGALSPAYVRVSDTWANTMFFQDSTATTPGPAPAGFGAVLTGPEWKGVIDFSNALDAKIVTSFSIGTGVRDANGIWTPREASKFLNFTREAGGNIAAAEFFNEPNLAAIGGAPKGYDAAAYGRDFKVFRAFVKQADPAMTILGPGPIGEGKVLGKMPAGLKTEDMLQAEGPGLDALSYHFYGAVSQRCTWMGATLQTSPEAALSSKWLLATNEEARFYGKLRDRFEPGKPLWLSETADAACGGNPWAASFIDSFRYLNQLGSLAHRGLQVVMHNTLVGSDYGLIDRDTLMPRPNYWAALLWRRLMGTTVLEAGAGVVSNQYLYAHCLRDRPGGVALLAINADRMTASELTIPTGYERYTLSASNLLASEVDLNGSALSVNQDGTLPVIHGVPQGPGTLTLAPATITFVAIPHADNQSCR